MSAKEVSVYRYCGIDEALNATIEPPTNGNGQHRYATLTWITANRNVRLVPDSERSVDPMVLDMNGMCFLPD